MPRLGFGPTDDEKAAARARQNARHSRAAKRGAEKARKERKAKAKTDARAKAAAKAALEPKICRACRKPCSTLDFRPAQSTICIACMQSDARRRYLLRAAELRAKGDEVKYISGLQQRVLCSAWTSAGLGWL